MKHERKEGSEEEKGKELMENLPQGCCFGEAREEAGGSIGTKALPEAPCLVITGMICV